MLFHEATKLKRGRRRYISHIEYSIEARLHIDIDHVSSTPEACLKLISQLKSIL